MKYKDDHEQEIKRAINYAKASMEMEGFSVTKKDEEIIKKKLLEQKKRKEKHER